MICKENNTLVEVPDVRIYTQNWMYTRTFIAHIS